MTGSVTHDWVQELPWKMQSVIFSGLRGPDTHHCPKLKALVRWLRPATQQNADPTTDYMRKEKIPRWKEVQKELEFTSVHYYAHLMHAIEIIGHYHPDDATRVEAFKFYLEMVWALHLSPETRIHLDERLG